MNKDWVKIVWKESILPTWLFALIHSNCKTEDGERAFSTGYGGTDYWGKERKSFLCEKHEVIKDFRE